MNARHTDALDRAIGRIVDTMQPEAIYLFGSHARGDAGADTIETWRKEIETVRSMF